MWVSIMVTKNGFYWKILLLRLVSVSMSLAFVQGAQAQQTGLDYQSQICCLLMAVSLARTGRDFDHLGH